MLFTDIFSLITPGQRPTNCFACTNPTDEQCYSTVIANIYKQSTITVVLNDPKNWNDREVAAVFYRFQSCDKKWMQRGLINDKSPSSTINIVGDVKPNDSCEVVIVVANSNSFPDTQKRTKQDVDCPFLRAAYRHFMNKVFPMFWTLPYRNVVNHYAPIKDLDDWFVEIMNEVDRMSQNAPLAITYPTRTGY